MLLPIDENNKIILEDVYNNQNRLINFIYDNQRWFFIFKKENRVFFEIISYELAKDFGISSADCYLAKTAKYFGIISKAVYNEDEQFCTCEFLKDYDLKVSIECFVNYFAEKDYESSRKIEKELAMMFMFDTLIGNPDRHSGNIGRILRNRKYMISPLFDNAAIGDLDYTKGLCGLRVSENEEKGNELELFLIKYPEYLEYFKSKLWIIERDNLDKIFARIKETKNIEIPEDIKIYVKESLAKNLEIIKEVISKFDYSVSIKM